MHQAESFINELLARADARPASGSLLQYLCLIQRQYSCIPETTVHVLAERLSIPASQVFSVIDFYTFLHRTPRGDFDILFSNNITDRMLGSQALFGRLCQILHVEPGVPRADGRVTVDWTSCTGLCDQGPGMLVNGIAVSSLDEKRINEIAEQVENKTPLKQWPADWFEIKDNIQRRDILLSDQIVNGSAIEALINKGAENLLQAIEQSGLRGRGGAGFPTAKKWRFCRDTKADDYYVVCNADEGEPGTFKDRVLLNSYADNLFEGMTVCAGIIGAKKGYLYLRGEYLYLREALEETLQQRRQSGLLGNNILGQEGFDFDIDIHLGAGAYICGEESALLESLEGKRGIPRKRPPYPVNQGLFGKPTVINNVETFINAAKIAVFGADWLRAAGTEQSAGTKLLSISGDCERPGIYEYPFGTSVSQILADCGAADTQAVQIAGAAGTTLTADAFERSICFEDLATGGSFMVFNQQRELLAMVKNFSDFFRHESCGFCTPCRVGGALINDLVNKVMVGHATQLDLEEMKNIGSLMQQASHCGLGATAPNAVLQTLEKFPDIYTARLANRSFEPAFDIDAALAPSRKITRRDDPGAHIAYEPEQSSKP